MGGFARARRAVPWQLQARLTAKGRAAPVLILLLFHSAGLAPTKVMATALSGATAAAGTTAVLSVSSDISDSDISTPPRSNGAHRLLLQGKQGQPQTNSVASEATSDAELCVRPLAPGNCDFSACQRMRAYAAQHSDLASQGRVLMWRAPPSLGNCLIAVVHMHRIAMALRLALFLDLSEFPSFHLMLQPNSFDWSWPRPRGATLAPDTNSSSGPGYGMALGDPEVTLRAATSRESPLEDLHLVTRYDGWLSVPAAEFKGDALLQKHIASEELKLIRTAGDRFPRDDEALEAEMSACSLRMLLRRSPAADVYMRLLRQRTWTVASSTGDAGDGGGAMEPECVDAASGAAPYLAWHVRTSAGEAGQGEADEFVPAIHSYVFTQPAAEVCSVFARAQEEALQEAGAAGGVEAQAQSPCTFVATNSHSVKQECRRLLGNRMVSLPNLDMDQSWIHTHTKEALLDPRPGYLAVLDFLFLMDSGQLVIGFSSTAGMAVQALGWPCRALETNVTQPVLFCAPSI